MRRVLLVLGMLAGLIALAAPPAHADSLGWTIPSTGSTSYSSAAYGNGRYVILSDSSGSGLTSTDGFTFSPLATGQARQVNDVIYAGGQFVAVAGGGMTCCNILTSSDGLTWTGRTSSLTQSYASIAYGNGVYVTVASTNGGPGAAWSANGITWDFITTGARNNATGVAFGNGTFVEVDIYGQVSTSADGETWTPQTSGLTTAYDIIFGNGVFVIVDSSSAARAYVSTDGITWTPATNMPAASWKAVTFGGGNFMAVADGGDVVLSSDGFTWVSQGQPLGTNYLASTAYANGEYFVFSATGSDRLAIGRFPAGTQTPPAWHQAIGIEQKDSCPAGWGSSWQEWPNGGTGGFVCIRSLVYLGHEWVYVPGFV
jgi:hypothetical protein